MKRKELERRLRELGWMPLRQGGKHEVRCLRLVHGVRAQNSEIHERLAQAILKRAKERA